MSNRFSRHKPFKFKNTIPIIIASIGVGMLLAIILPFWIWIAAVGAGLIAFAWFSYWDK